MPELPEIETVKLQLQKVLVGHVLVNVQVITPKIVQGELAQLIGEKVEGIRRLGKVLLVDFAPGHTLGFHFKMTGQLIYDNGKTRIAGGHPSEDFVAKLPNSHTRVIFQFDQGTLFFNDQRMFGWVQINPQFVEHLGPEPFDISPEEFTARLGKSRRPIKVAIMDQEIISGVGNIYANDALWEARINPQLSAHKLTPEQSALLLEKIQLVLHEGIKYGGATAANYVNLHGMGGHYQDHFRTYNREGQPCFNCKTPLIRMVTGGRGTFYCPECQR